MMDPMPGSARRARARCSSSSHGEGTAATRDLTADRHAVDREALAAAVVRLHERADGPAADDARSRAGAALELVTDHARAAADPALGEPARRSPSRAPRTGARGRTCMPLMSLSAPS